ncbi:hypothetical protein [Lactococcus lactis]|nr:hypothetical protein [Lactococcus lactis]
MAVTTLKGHVSRALEFYNKPDIYIGIGKTTPKFYLSMSCYSDYKK